MQNERQQLVVLLIIIFIGFMGTSMVYPIFPPLFLHPIENSIVPFTWNTQMRSFFLGIALAAYPLGQFIGSPILGGCSYRYGRKSILLISLFGSTVGYALSALSFHFNSLWLLLMSRFLTGIMEGNVAIARAIAADLKSINKHKSFGRINAASSVGWVMGPLLGGFLSDNHFIAWFSFSVPFVLATLFSGTTIFLATQKLIIKKTIFKNGVSIWRRFNLINRFKMLCKNNLPLKNLLLISSVFTIAIDLFYEFGPVYLTGLWAMSPAWIAIYNAILCFSLTLGSGWMAHRLSLKFHIKQVLITAITITAIFFAFMAIWPSPLLAFILFGLVGLSISTTTTNITIQLSNAAANTVQGEAMGTQLSLRMLGDAVICLLGSFLIASSFILPITISALVALVAAIMYALKIR